MKLPIESDEPVFKVKYAKRDRQILIEIYFSPKEKKHLVVGPLFQDFEIMTLRKVKKASIIAIECEKKARNEKWPCLFEQQPEQKSKEPCAFRDKQLAREKPKASDETDSAFPTASPLLGSNLCSAGNGKPASPRKRLPQLTKVDQQQSSPFFAKPGKNDSKSKLIVRESDTCLFPAEEDQGRQNSASIAQDCLRSDLKTALFGSSKQTEKPTKKPNLHDLENRENIFSTAPALQQSSKLLGLKPDTAMQSERKSELNFGGKDAKGYVSNQTHNSQAESLSPNLKLRNKSPLRQALDAINQGIKQNMKKRAAVEMPSLSKQPSCTTSTGQDSSAKCSLSKANSDLAHRIVKAVGRSIDRVYNEKDKAFPEATVSSTTILETMRTHEGAKSSDDCCPKQAVCSKSSSSNLQYFQPAQETNQSVREQLSRPNFEDSMSDCKLNLHKVMRLVQSEADQKTLQEISRFSEKTPLLERVELQRKMITLLAKKLRREEVIRFKNEREFEIKLLADAVKLEQLVPADNPRKRS